MKEENARKTIYFALLLHTELKRMLCVGVSEINIEFITTITTTTTTSHPILHCNKAAKTKSKIHFNMQIVSMCECS